MTDFKPGAKKDGLSHEAPISEELRQESDELRKTEARGLEVHETYAEEGDHRRVFELSKSGNMRLILQEFTERQFAHGACTMNIKDTADDGTVTTRHMTVRVWGEGQLPCPSCHRVRNRAWFLADEGAVYECPQHCGVLILPLSVKWQIVLWKLKEHWVREYGILLTGGHGGVLKS